MYSPVLSVPSRRVSGWVAETDPRYARAWLATLPLADSMESARELYQSLYTINRLDLKVSVRIELMELYEPTIATIGAALHSQLANAAPPLGQKKRQLAEFIRRLHVEMAYGYKCSLRDLSRARLLLAKKPRYTRCLERALFHMSEVLRRSYLVYIPCPPGTWREMHELYRIADSLDVADETLVTEAGDVRAATITERYAQALLLGLVNPYHLPQSGVHQVQTFLAKWSEQARIVPATTNRCNAHFLIDLAADGPPTPYTGELPPENEMLRLLDAQMLVRALQVFIQRLEAGERNEASSLGMDCLDSACIELLRRMRRAWGNSVRRRYSRQQTNSSVFVCAGLQAIHYFSNGQRPFAVYRQRLPLLAPKDDAGSTPDVAFVELDEADTIDGERSSTSIPEVVSSERYRVERWKLRDISPQGMSIARYGDVTAVLRVGDLLGIQQPSDMGRWRATVVRWIKSPETSSVEVGMEVLAASVMPVAVRMGSSKTNEWVPGLRLPAVDLARRPSTILLARGACRVGDAIELIEEDGELRRARILRLLERTGSFEQIVCAEVVSS